MDSKLRCFVCFFFSSRRRHTRYIGDWSSDVCSSDLDRVRRSLLRGLRGVSWHSAWASSPRDCGDDPNATRRDDEQLDARDRPRVTFAGDFSGMIPERTGTTAVATNPGYAKLFVELDAGSL